MYKKSSQITTKLKNYSNLNEHHPHVPACYFFLYDKELSHKKEGTEIIST